MGFGLLGFVFFLIYYKKWLRDGWELRIYMHNDSFTFHPYGERLIVDQTCFLSFFFFFIPILEFRREIRT